MKTYWSTLLIFAVTFAYALNNFAQAKTGSYRKIPNSDAAAIAAAEFAAQTQSEKDDAEIALQTIEKAESQTVAGTNYRLCIEVFRIETGDDAEVRQFVQTIVFRNLKKQFALKSWETVEDCGESQ